MTIIRKEAKIKSILEQKNKLYCNSSHCFHVTISLIKVNLLF